MSYGPSWWVVHWQWALLGGGFIAFILFQALCWWSDRRMWTEVRRSLAELETEEKKLWDLTMRLLPPHGQKPS